LERGQSQKKGSSGCPGNVEVGEKKPSCKGKEKEKMVKRRVWQP